MSPEEKLAAVLENALVTTKTSVVPLLGMMPSKDSTALDRAWGSMADEAYDLFRTTYTDEEIDFLYDQHFSEVGKQVAAKQQAIMGAMFEMGSRLLGPHVEPSDV